MHERYPGSARTFQAELAKLGYYAGAANGQIDADTKAAVDLVEVLLADDQRLLDEFGRWYLHDRDPRWLRRNALVVLGNSGVDPDTRVRTVLDRYLSGPDPLLRRHAAWATEQLGVMSAPTAEAG